MAPCWYETYGDSTVLVACASGWGIAAEDDSEAVLLFYHRLASKLDRAILPLAGTVWKVQRYTMPYYCAICPCVNSESHANVVIDVALRLHAAAAKLLVNGQHVQMSIGVSSGSTSVGLIGQDGLSVFATGEPVGTAKKLADCGDALLVHPTTWCRMSVSVQERVSWVYMRPQLLRGNLNGTAVYSAVIPGPVASLATATGANAAAAAAASASAERQQEAAPVKPAPLPSISAMHCRVEIPSEDCAADMCNRQPGADLARGPDLQMLEGTSEGASAAKNGLQAAAAPALSPISPAVSAGSSSGGMGCPSEPSSSSSRPDNTLGCTVATDIDSAFNQEAERVRPVFKPLDAVEGKTPGAWRVVGHSDAVVAQQAIMMRHVSSGAVERQHHPGAQEQGAVSAPVGLVVFSPPEQTASSALSAFVTAVSEQVETVDANSSNNSAHVGFLEAPAWLRASGTSSSSRPEGRASMNRTKPINQQEEQRQEGDVKRGVGTSSTSDTRRVSGSSGKNWVSRLKALLSPSG